jgi:hypothetical protein
MDRLQWTWRKLGHSEYGLTIRHLIEKPHERNRSIGEALLGKSLPNRGAGLVPEVGLEPT